MFLNKDLKSVYTQLAEGIYVNYPFDEAQSIAKIVLASTGYTLSDLITKGAEIVSTQKLEYLELVLKRLQDNEPVQYILGKTEFYGLNLKVDSSVLIPRQETEELVDLIIKENRNTHTRILEIGTGSGCIALSLKKNIPEAKVDALDVSKSALDVALKNAEILGLNVHFHHMDILHEALLPGDYDIIVSNPPYTTESEKSEILGNVLYHEPHEALFIPDHSPLVFYECIIELSRQHLSKGGALYFEINERLGLEVKTLLNETGFQDVRIIKDLNGKDRFAAASSY